MVVTLFHLTNFALVVIIGYLFIRRVVVGFFLRQRTYDVLLIQAKQRKSDELFKQKNSLSMSAERQQLEYEELMHKTAQWRNAITHTQEERTDEQARILELVCERRKEQAHELRRSTINACVIPEAVDAARNELQKLFADPVYAERYMNQLLNSLDEERS